MLFRLRGGYIIEVKVKVCNIRRRLVLAKGLDPHKHISLYIRVHFKNRTMLEKSSTVVLGLSKPKGARLNNAKLFSNVVLKACEVYSTIES